MLMEIMFCVILSFKKYIYIYIFFQVFIPSGQSSKIERRVTAIIRKAP